MNQPSCGFGSKRSAEVRQNWEGNSNRDPICVGRVGASPELFLLLKNAAGLFSRLGLVLFSTNVLKRSIYTLL
jgi:hypothetical protein